MINTSGIGMLLAYPMDDEASTCILSNATVHPLRSRLADFAAPQASRMRCNQIVPSNRQLGLWRCLLPHSPSTWHLSP